MRIAVLGGGHGCFAAAADLTEKGHQVALWRRSAGQFGALTKDRSLHLTDRAGSRVVQVAMVTGDLAAALRDAELIVLPTPAFAQIDIATAMAPHLQARQVVFLAPGTLGSVVMAKAIREAGCRHRIAFAETGTLPYLARKHGPAEVTITMHAQRLPVGVFPSDDTARAIGIISQAYPCVHAIEDVLSAALMNAGPIIHPPLILMNAGPLEHFGQWDIHNEGTQPSIRRVTNALDQERIAIREALGYQPYHYPLRDHYESDRWMYGDAHQRLVDSGDWREKIDLYVHRYMTEDVAYGLSLLVSIGGFAGVQTPVATGLLALGAAVCEQQFAYGERTLASIGLGDLPAPALQQLLKRGWGDSNPGSA